ncbi:MAG: UDP-N-acetylglucosamine 1-carboxyvinyltransferase [Actinomycetota bacterium]|nr:UDP-N-acetylglucosamine 1-carboxyvinyltransferase [Actinomycetota bacterium]
MLGATMDVFVVSGGGPLTGAVRVGGAKNSALKLVAAALLAPGRTVVHNVPDIADMQVMNRVLQHLGVGVRREGAVLTLDVPAQVGDSTPADLASKLRASIVVLGPLLARRGSVRIATPGGCNLGSRAIDLHLSGLARMGAQIDVGPEHVEARARRLVGTDIELPYASVGATENLLMAAVTASGTTRLGNAAREPEIVDLVEFLQSMGANIRGGGTSEIEVRGVGELRPTRHVVIGDRIEAGTFAVAAAVTRGTIDLQGVRPDHLRLALHKLQAAGVEVAERADGLIVHGGGELQAVDVVTLPFPGVPTDLLSAFLLLASQARGTSMLTENVYESRFSVIDEMVRLGADIHLEGHHAIVRGPAPLTGAVVRATDLRAGAALVIAGLVADGETVVTDPYHVDRGYNDFAARLAALGGNVRRADVVPSLV